MSVANKIKQKLETAFSPQKLNVFDQSDQHAGHAGSRPEGETHFMIEIESETFSGKSRVEMHRMVNSVLADELAGPVHAMALTASTPGRS